MPPLFLQLGAVEVGHDHDVALFQLRGKPLDEVVADDVERDASGRTGSQDAPFVQRHRLHAAGGALRLLRRVLLVESACG